MKIVNVLILLLLSFATYGQGLNIRPPDPTPPATGSFEWKGDSLCVTLNGVQDCELVKEYTAGEYPLGSVSSGWNEYTIPFNKTYSAPPIVTVTLKGNAPNHAQRIGLYQIKQVTNTDFTFRIYGLIPQPAGGVFAHWKAIPPK